MEYQVELTRFRVKQGKSNVVDQWMALLNEHMPEVLLTLKDEKMYVESIFREVAEDAEYLYWYSIQGPGGMAVEESCHEIDKKHLDFWHECIDEEYKPIDMRPEAVMIQEKVASAMKDF
ncbi:DUF6176 family protein [Bacillus sp. 1P06AnD]|uniref:DUF6176 family protein n=1 Tax=Bacillus sp. 1P06AnD TaxID=3132208 RepID=UPI0039A1869A